MSEVVLAARQVVKRVHDGRHDITILKGLDLTIRAGEFVSIIGASGSGKSTLLHLLGGLDRPTSGDVEVMAYPLSQLDDRQRGNIRNKYMGFVYQFHHLLPEFDAVENVSMPLLLRADADLSAVRQQAELLLTKVGLSHRLHHKPSELSGGERQRVAIARALVNQPKIVLADEPTGNLDQQTAQDVLAVMQELRQELAMALLIVTHDRALAGSADRVLHMQDGLWRV